MERTNVVEHQVQSSNKRHSATEQLGQRKSAVEHDALKGTEDGTTTGSFLTLTHGYLWSAITFAEQKAAFVFAADSAFLGYLTSSGLLKTILTHAPSSWRFAEYFGIVATASFLASIILVLSVVVPRLGGAARGVIYFNAIADRPSADSYAADVIRLDDFGRTREILHHCYEVAVICRRKYAGVRLAMLFGAIGLICGLGYVSGAR